MKKVFFIILASLLLVYIIATLFYNRGYKPEPTVCKEVAIVISDSLEKHFLTDSDVVAYLKRVKQYPLQKKSTEINTQNIENALLKNEIIAKAEVFQAISGKINIVISQKMPILRVFSGGGSYFVDVNGLTMPAVPGQAIYVPVASGNIEKSFATTELYKFALFLQSDEFWNAQIEQIYVRSAGDVELVPRIGGHRILMGSLDDYEGKLARLRLFYEQVIPKMGWGKYSVINLKYKNQIVCTKSKNTES